MKKIMSIVLTVLLLLALTACGGQKQEAQTLGGWQVDRETSLEVPDGVLHLASQTVAGTNHVVLCKGWSLCFVSADTQGKTEVVKSVPLDIAALSQPAEG